MENLGAGIPHLTDLRGKSVLVVEDEYLLAADLARKLDQNGAQVIGPFPTVEQAMAYLTSHAAPDFAMLDINLRGEMVFPVAEHLMAAGVPLLFVTGYDPSTLPAKFAAVPRLEKPVDLW